MKKNIPELRFKGFDGEWEQRKLGELLEGLVAGVSVNSSEEKTGFYILKTSAIKSGIVDISEVKNITQEELNRAKTHIAKGSIIISRMNTPELVGASGLVIDNRENIFIPDRLWQGKIKENFSSDWLIQSINTTKVISKIRDLATGTSGSMKNISKSSILNLDLNIPIQDEQQKIGQFFLLLDRLINLQKRKVEALEKLKKCYLQKIFFNKIKFSQDNHKWSVQKLGQVLVKNSEKNKNSKFDNVESVSNKYGFVRQSDYFEDRAIASQDTSNYYVIRKNSFAFNPSRINVGSIAIKLDDEISIVSPLYISFYTSDKIDNQFLWCWFKSTQFERQRQFLTAGGVRDTLSFDALSEMKISFPELSVQEAIGKLFQKIDENTKANQLKLNQLVSLKKVYQQKIFI